jgi:hypothetical protein
LKRGWTQLWRIGSLLLLCMFARPRTQAQLQQRQAQSQTRDVSATHHVPTDAVEQNRNYELTLAGLRPGRDAMTKAVHIFPRSSAIADGGANRTWHDDCRRELLSIIADSDGGIIEVRAAQAAGPKHPCRDADATTNRWITGHGLVVGDACSRVTALYGQPGSRGPSTKGGQQLELFYYAFDWAGPDVPQVMTVLCTPDAQAKPGRVVEITLAAPSL